MADLANVVVKGEFDGQELIAGLKEVSKLGKKAATDSDLLNKAVGKLSGIMETMGGDVKNAFNTLSQGFDNLSRKVDEQTQTFNRLASAVNKAKKQAKEFSDVQKQAAGTADKITGNNTRGAAQANRFNSANFLAQFQDIAVTSAMGMNPMLIAMQQGTQLQYILAQSNAPLKDFVAGLKSAFSVAGMLTIGLTAVVAALIQMVNWSKIGEIVTKGLASAFNALGMTKIANWFENLIDYSKEAWEAIKKLLNVSKDFNNEMNDLLDKNFLLETELLNPEGLNEKELREYIYTQEKYGKLLNDLNKQKSSFMNDLLDENLSDTKYKERYNAYMKEYEIERRDAWLKAQDWANAKMKNDELKKAIEARNEMQKKSLKEEKTEVEKLAEAWDKLQISSRNKIQDLQTNISVVGAGTYEKTYVQTLNDLIRQAESSGIDLYGANNKYEQLQKDAEGIAKLTEEYEKLNDKVEFSKSTIKGFFSDMRHGLRDGESAWEAFGNAVTNVLDKILDKIMDIGVDTLFNIGYGYGKTSGWWGTGNISSGSTWNPATSAPVAKPAALGGVWDDGIQKFARGGIVTSPTTFGIRHGVGLMGEAGPEAIMPLTRGPDGSLGVRADNTNSSPVVVNVINNSNAQAKVEQRQTSQGMEIDVMIDQLVAEKMKQPGTSSNSALRAFNNQKLIAR